MNRDAMRARLAEQAGPFDFVVIGGGATGVGFAIDAAARGYTVALFEQSDFGKGTSSRSTKLVHGGVRYLQQGNIPLVMEALRERGLLRRNAPHLVHELPFIVPNYQWWEAPFYGIGMRIYDALAGRYGFGSSRNLSWEETVARLPTIETKGLRGGVLYHDGQFDDARLLIAMARTAAERGAVLLNYTEVVALEKDAGGYVSGVGIRYVETGETRRVDARIVVNCTGVFADRIRQLDDPTAPPVLRPSQGVHIVLDSSFLPGDSAIMVPHTDDGRVLFAIPWHGRLVIGTTDTPVSDVALEPKAGDDEIEYLIEHIARYLERDPRPDDVLSVFAGLRPLVAAGGDDADTASISREHSILVAKSGLVTVAGGKWTTYRRMAEEAVDHASVLAGLEPRPCPTRALPIHGADAAARDDVLRPWGSDAAGIEALMRERPALAEPLDANLELPAAVVVWAARHEMARTVDDVLARRTRALLLDARAALRAAPRVAAMMAEELGRDRDWADGEVAAFQEIARNYLPG